MTRQGATFRFFTLSLLVALSASLTAQTPLQRLEQRFREEMQQLAASSPTYEQREQLMDRHLQELERFLAETAKGDDRWNGRLMQADLELARGRQDAAQKALMAIDAAEAPAMVLVTGATMAQHLGLSDLRDQWVDAAIGKDAPLGERMAMARLLMTVLEEVDKGEALFDKALQMAETDEDRAFVRWHRADALRDREDLPENSGFDALAALAKELPGTYWGSVAKDRLRATRLEIGDEAIQFTATTLDGKNFSLAAQRGKPVLLAFWTVADYDLERMVEIVEELQKQHASLVVIGVNLDRDPAQIREAVRQLSIDFPVVGTGKGIETDAALRWFAEGATVHVIDKEGRVQGLGLQVGTNDGREQLRRTVARVAGE